MYKFARIHPRTPETQLDVNNEKHCITSQTQGNTLYLRKYNIFKIGCEETHTCCKINRSVLWEAREAWFVQFPSLQNNLTDAGRNCSKWEAGSVGDNGEFEEWWPAGMEKEWRQAQTSLSCQMEEKRKAKSLCVNISHSFQSTRQSQKDSLSC